TSPAAVFTGGDTPPGVRLKAASSSGLGPPPPAKRPVRATLDSEAARPSSFACPVKSFAASSFGRISSARAVITFSAASGSRPARLLELRRVLPVVALHRVVRHGLEEVFPGKRHGEDLAALGLSELVRMRAQVLPELVVARRRRGEERPELDQRPRRTDLLAAQDEGVLDFRGRDLHAARHEPPYPPGRQLTTHFVDVGRLANAGALEDLLEARPPA